MPHLAGVSVHAKSLQLCLAFCDPVDCSPPGSSIFTRQEYWSGLPCPPPGNVPNPGIELTSLRSPALAGRFFTTRASYPYIMKYSSYRRDRLHAQFSALDYQFLLGFLNIADTGRDWGQEEKGTTEDELVGWHHGFNGCGFE